MADAFDDFFDDDRPASNSLSSVGGLGNTLASSSTLMPIVEVPSENNSFGAGSARSTASDDKRSTTSDDKASTARSLSNAESDGSTDDKNDKYSHTYPQKSSRKKSKHRRKNGHNEIDMTPPEKLLKKAEKKATKYKKDKKIDQAVTEYTRCTALSRVVYGDGHWKLANAHIELAQAYLELKSYHLQAYEHSEHARAIMMNSVQILESSSSENDKANILGVLLNIYYILGRSLTANKKFTEAEQALNKAEKIAAKRSKIESISDDELDEWDVKIFLAIARLNMKQHKYESSSDYFDKALEILEDLHGKDAVELIPVFQGLGHVEINRGKQGDNEAMLEHFLQAHSITNKHYGDDSEKSAETAYALAMAYTCVGEEDAEISAESYINDALATYQSVHGPEHQKTLELQDDLAKIMIRTERHSEAIVLLRKTLEYKSETYGEFSNEVADTHKLIGNVHLANGDAEKALKSLRKCASIQTTALGASSRKVKDTQKTIDLLLSNPQLAAKQKKTKADALKERPRFNSVVNRSTPGNVKTAAF